MRGGGRMRREEGEGQQETGNSCSDCKIKLVLHGDFDILAKLIAKKLNDSVR